jgi:transcriptional regulator with XRE-family HTH domain
MGRGTRWKPKKLAGKLAAIRTRLGLSQNGMVDALGLRGKVNREVISTFERGTREPPLPILLLYARVVGVSVETLIDDKLKLPEQ